LALFRLSENEKALEDFSQCLKINPKFAIAHYNKGLVFADLEKYDKAIASYNKSIKYKPDDYTVLNSRGDAFLELKKYTEAVSDYDRALRSKSDDYITWDKRGIALYNLNKHKEADYSWNKALEYNNEDGGMLYGTARFYGLRPDLSLAIKNLAKAITLNSECKERAKTDYSFDLIREEPSFQALIF
jgi:tetratricopeptide (TPR) repeat protein